jgi:hypothetical protein
MTNDIRNLHATNGNNQWKLIFKGLNRSLRSMMAFSGIVSGIGFPWALPGIPGSPGYDHTVSPFAGHEGMERVRHRVRETELRTIPLVNYTDNKTTTQQTRSLIYRAEQTTSGDITSIMRIAADHLFVLLVNFERRQNSSSSSYSYSYQQRRLRSTALTEHRTNGRHIR